MANERWLTASAMARLLLLAVALSLSALPSLLPRMQGEVHVGLPGDVPMIMALQQHRE